VLGAVAAAGGCGGSGGPKACTLIGCHDQFLAGVSSSDGLLPSGMHRIEVLADGASLMCTFTAPLQAAPGGGLMQPSCPTGLTVIVTPAADAQVETISLAGTPAQVHVWQYVDDVAILDAAVAPSYVETQPNGPGCPPICRQASASWTLM
jgi:hypothetical protein